MSLYAFLNVPTEPEEKEVYISDRFKKEDGSIQFFKIRSISQEENDEITRKSYKSVKVKGITQDKFDAVEYNHRLVVAATIEPDFKNKELCDHFKTIDPLQLPGKMLKPGEFSKLLNEISDLSGFNDNEDNSLKN